MEKIEKTNIDYEKLKTFAKLGGLLLSILVLMAGGLSWLGNEFIRRESFEMYQVSIAEHHIRQEEKIADLIRVIEAERLRRDNEIMKYIKDSSAIGLIARRDFLLSREDSLSSVERAELNFLSHKLRQLNLEK
jgi:hypothetical protein